MIEIKETTADDIRNVQRLWADGEVMRFVGFPEGLHETDESMFEWFNDMVSNRPAANHFSIFEDGKFCGETGYGYDKEYRSAWLDIKLFPFARGRGIASKAISYAIGRAFALGAEVVWVDPHPHNVKAFMLYERLGFEKKPMPEHVIEIGEDPAEYVYMELRRDIG